MDSGDRDSAAGRRDFAILVLLVRLDLLAGRSPAWIWATSASGRARSPCEGKGSRRDILPSPVDTGEVVAGAPEGRRQPGGVCAAALTAWPTCCRQRVVCRPGPRTGRDYRRRGALAAALQAVGMQVSIWSRRRHPRCSSTRSA